MPDLNNNRQRNFWPCSFGVALHICSVLQVHMMFLPPMSPPPPLLPLAMMLIPLLSIFSLVQFVDFRSFSSMFVWKKPYHILTYTRIKKEG